MSNTLLMAAPALSAVTSTPAPHLELWSAVLAVSPVLLISYGFYVRNGLDRIRDCARDGEVKGARRISRTLMLLLFVFGVVPCGMAFSVALVSLLLRADWLGVWGLYATWCSLTVAAIVPVGFLLVGVWFETTRMLLQEAPGKRPADPTVEAVAALTEEVRALRAELATVRSQPRPWWRR